MVEPALPAPGKGFEGGVEGAGPVGIGGEGRGEGERAEVLGRPESFGEGCGEVVLGVDGVGV